jgi:polar amino acid transport system substrate-binding protein
VQASVAEGKYDLAISALAYTPGRAGAMELSKGYHLSGESSLYGIIIRNEDSENIKSVDDLADRTIITQSGSLQEALANENIPKYKEFKRVSSMQDAFLAVQEGKADADVIDRENALLYIQNNPGCDMMVVDEIAFKLDEVYDGTRVGTEKGEIQLMYFVNGVIDEMLEEGLYEKWFAEYAEYAGKLGVE